ncbi:MAG: TonB family protein [Candidatus Acidiferrales bacterium]
MSSYAAARPEPSLKGSFWLSLVFHIVLVTAFGVSAVFNHNGESWGGPGGSMSVGLVGSVPAIPLPKPDVVTESRVVDESKGLYKSEPQPKPKVEENATPLPKFEKNKPPKYNSRPSKLLENPKPPPPNAVPYGGGGTPSVPYSSATTMTLGSSTTGGMSFNGAGGGNFAQRYSWYVEAVQRRVSSNWLQATVDPSVQFAPRVVVDFEIMRDGSVAAVQVVRGSGNASVDTSAMRAVQASSPLQRLPNDYNGSYVNVEFWFDFQRH